MASDWKGCASQKNRCKPKEHARTPAAAADTHTYGKKKGNSGKSLIHRCQSTAKNPRKMDATHRREEQGPGSNDRLYPLSDNKNKGGEVRKEKKKRENSEN